MGKLYFFSFYKRRGIEIIYLIQDLGMKTKMLKTVSFFVKSLRCCERVAPTCVALRLFGSDFINELGGCGWEAGLGVPWPGDEPGWCRSQRRVPVLVPGPRCSCWHLHRVPGAADGAGVQWAAEPPVVKRRIHGSSAVIARQNSTLY